MSEEEKKAIEFMFFYKEHCLNIEKKNIKNYETVNDEEFVYKNINTVLNLIEKQQKEIEKNKNFIDFLQSNDVKKLGEIIKKDKIIDLMAEQLTTPVNSKEWIKKYYERRAEDVKN